MDFLDNPFFLWLLAALLTFIGAFAIYAVAWVVVTLVAAILAAGTVACVALGGALFIVSLVVAVHLSDM